MPFIDKKQAFRLLDMMMKGTCVGNCRQGWLRNIGYALKTHTNPLHLTAEEHQKMTAKLAEVKKSRPKMTRKIAKKYLIRDSPPYPANDNCGKTMRGYDGKMYTSVPDKNGVCRWRLKPAH